MSKSFEFHPGTDWEKIYLALRSEDRDTREEATQQFVAAHIAYYTADEFARQEGVEPFSWQDGILWCRREDLPWADPRHGKPLQRPEDIISSVVNQIVLIKTEEDWVFPIRGLCSCPFAYVFIPEAITALGYLTREYPGRDTDEFELVHVATIEAFFKEWGPNTFEEADTLVLRFPLLRRAVEG